MQRLSLGSGLRGIQREHTAMHTFYNGSCPHLRFWNPANAGRALVVHVLDLGLNFSKSWGEETYPGLNASKATKLLIASLLPFRNKTMITEP